MPRDVRDLPEIEGERAASDRLSVTVLVATYNGEQHIRDQLESLLRQTRPPSEILIVDDASTDGTVASAREVLSTGTIPFRVQVNLRQVGPWDNFLDGLKNCRGDLVAFCDQDDVWSDSKLALCVDRLANKNTLLVIHNAMLTDEELRPLKQLDQQIEMSQLHPPMTLDPYVGPTAGWGNCMVFRREIASLLSMASRPAQPGEARLLSHDTWMYVVCAALGQVAHVVTPLTFYRQHGSNVTVSARPMSVRFADHFRDPSPIYRRRARFYEECRLAFADLAARGDVSPSWTIAGAQAERCYAARAAFWNARVATYSAPALSARLKAFARVGRLVKQTTEFSRYAGPISRAKDLVNAMIRPLRGSQRRFMRKVQLEFDEPCGEGPPMTKRG